MRKFKSPEKHRKPVYRVRAAYRGMKRRCVGGKANGKKGCESYKNVYLRMTEEEWIAWALPQYEKFIKENPDRSPSVARNGDVGDYKIGNIKIISSEENRAEQRAVLLVREDGKKLCGKCRVDLPVENFSKNKTRPDGLCHWCRSCAKNHRENMDR